MGAAVLLAACAPQREPDPGHPATGCPAADGSWLGVVEVAGTPLRLVFHVTVGEDGTLTGTVDSPDRGVIGLPLSGVMVSGDSVFFEIAAAQAGFAGVRSGDGTNIEGVWTEGASTTPLVLTCTDAESAPVAARGEVTVHGVALELRRRSETFDFYATADDREVLAELDRVLEAAQARVTGDLGTRFSERVRVYIYPDLATFHAAIGQPGAPEWVIGAAGFNELNLVSPANPGPVHTYQSVVQAAVHELVHAAVINLRGGRGLAGLPAWLNEGYAFVEAEQMTQGMRVTLRARYAGRALPAWSDIADAGFAEFGSMDGYYLSATIVEFLLERFGRDRLVALLRNPEDIEAIYGMPATELEALWRETLASRI